MLLWIHRGALIPSYHQIQPTAAPPTLSVPDGLPFSLVMQSVSSSSLSSKSTSKASKAALLTALAILPFGFAAQAATAASADDVAAFTRLQLSF